MKVLLYAGLSHVVSKSGVGQAMRHQAATLKKQNVRCTKRLRDDFDVVHLNTIFPDSLIVSKWARFRGKKVIYYAHSTMEDFRNSFIGSNLLAPLFKRWITYCYNNSDLIITPTEYAKGLLDRYGLQPEIRVISNGIDTTFFEKDTAARQRFRQKYNIADEQKVVISVGHYIERKGIMDFVELARQLPQYQFFWFGYTNPYLVPKKIRSELATDLPNLHFPGYVDRDNLKDAYCGGDLFLFLTHEETEGIVVLEALAARIPILVRDIPIYAGWLADSEIAYKGSDVQGFKSMIENMLSAKLPDLTENGRQVAEARDLLSVGRKLRGVYSQLNVG